jgi:N-methylhydantoinase A
LIGIDTGGTFTDLIAFHDGRLLTHKVLSTPHNPADAVFQGLKELFDSPRALPAAGRRLLNPSLTYSSTVATNALLERKGARVVLLTTAGFEDIIEIGRQNRPDLYALEPRKPEALVPRARRIGVEERMRFDGTALVPLSAAAIRHALRAARRLRPDAIAVCLLHSYANPAHEELLGQALARRGAPFVSLSHQLVAEHREYERLSTTVINAYVGPVMSRHLAELERGLGERVRLRVLQSNGGAIPADLARREAVRTCLSGPAGGVIGAQRVGAELNLSRLITFDMGGTSTDVSVVDGSAAYTTEWEIGGLPLKVPAIDIHTVGAGGGSLAYVDPGGLLKVGPQSAGADPGPACYGRGSQAAVTDANLLLGRLAADAFLDGRMPLDNLRAERAVARIGRPLKLDVQAAAEGIVRVVNAVMERAIRRVSVERGRDPRHYTLVAFGGAAGQHACELAESLGMHRVVVPAHPGLLSAWGAARAQLQRDAARSVRRTKLSFSELQRLAAPLASRLRRDLRSEGVRSVRLQASVDLRYSGQSYEINVPLDASFVAAFHAVHQRLYGYADPQRDVEIVSLRVTATAGTREPRWSSLRPRHRTSPFPHRVYVGGRWRQAQIWQRHHLPSGARIAGPVLIAELSATTFVPPRWQVHAHRSGHLLIERL